MKPKDEPMSAGPIAPRQRNEYDEAIDRIAALTAENERLKRDFAQAMDNEADDAGEIRELNAEVIEAEAENERLKRALEGIGATEHRGDRTVCIRCNLSVEHCDRNFMPGNDGCMGRLARRALTSTTPPPAAEPKYPCDCCGLPRTKSEGGTTFTVCDHCWDNCKHGEPHVAAAASPVAPAEDFPRSSTQLPRQVAGPVAAVPGAAPASLEGKPATSPDGAAPPVALRPARTVAHEFEASYEDCPGQQPWNGHSDSCDRLTAAIEADRTQRTGLDGLLLGTVERISLTECPYAESYGTCQEATEDQDFDGVCPKCIATEALAAVRALAGAQPRGEKL
jgi:hypothetical protein